MAEQPRDVLALPRADQHPGARPRRRRAGVVVAGPARARDEILDAIAVEIERLAEPEPELATGRAPVEAEQLARAVGAGPGTRVIAAPGGQGRPDGGGYGAVTIEQQATNRVLLQLGSPSVVSAEIAPVAGVSVTYLPTWP